MKEGAAPDAVPQREMGAIFAVNPIRTNHVGYPCHAEKRFVYEGPETDFTVERLHDCRAEVCCSGRTTRTCPSEEKYTVGDFSGVSEEGVYRVRCGNQMGWSFVIYDRAYDTVCRVLENYFVWQRCGDETGWAGNCHAPSTLVTKDGRTHSICGGHHQSCDLRKWCEFQTVGTRRLCDAYAQNHPLWDRAGDALYDITRSAEYFSSLVSAEGYVFDCTFLPEGYSHEEQHGKGFGDLKAWWKPFIYYDSPAPAIGEWNTLMLLADAAGALAESNPALSETCRIHAEKIWNWMQTEGKSLPVYDWVTPPPLGHDGFREGLFRFFYRDSAQMLSYEIAAAAALFRLIGKQEYYEAAEAAIGKLLALEVSDAKQGHVCFRIGEGEQEPAERVGSPALSLAEALETWPDRPVSASLRSFAERYLLRVEQLAAHSPFGIVQSTYRFGEDGKVLHPLGDEFVDNGDLANLAIALMKFAPFTDRERCLAHAQHLLDWLIGCNPYDASSIEGVGRNQPPRYMSAAEFFPPTPQIPGAVITNVWSWSFDPETQCAEYDMPIVGAVLYAFALYDRMV